MSGQSRSRSRFRKPTGLPSTSTTSRTCDGVDSFFALVVLINLCSPVCVLLEPLYRGDNMAPADAVFLHQRFRWSRPRNFTHRQLHHSCVISDNFENGVAQTALLIMIFNYYDSPACLLGGF